MGDGNHDQGDAQPDLVSRPATFAPFRRGPCTKDLIAAAGSESYLGIVRVRMTRCHLACLPLILPALLSV